jgi:hypothetical protein
MNKPQTWREWALGYADMIESPLTVRKALRAEWYFTYHSLRLTLQDAGKWLRQRLTRSRSDHAGH